MKCWRKSSPLNFEGARDLEDSSLKGQENDRYELIHSPDGNLASPNSSSPAQISVSQLRLTFYIYMLHTGAEQSNRGGGRVVLREGSTHSWFKSNSFLLKI